MYYFFRAVTFKVGWSTLWAVGREEGGGGSAHIKADKENSVLPRYACVEVAAGGVYHHHHPAQEQTV